MGEAISGPSFLRAEDLIQDQKWATLTLVIKEVHKENTQNRADGKLIDKPVIDFENHPKRMILNKVNQRLMIYATGHNNATNWVGLSVTLYAASGNWFKKSRVAALRIKLPEGNYHAFLADSAVGVDITGKGFASCKPVPATPAPAPPAQPAKKQGMAEQIDAAKDAAAMEALLTGWRKARPPAKHAESWGDILKLASRAAIAAMWPASDARDSLDLLISDITAELEPPKPEPSPVAKMPPHSPITLAAAQAAMTGCVDMLAMADVDARINCSPDLSEADIAILIECKKTATDRITADFAASETTAAPF